MLHLKSVLEENACLQCVTFSICLLFAIAVLGIPMSKDHDKGPKAIEVTVMSAVMQFNSNIPAGV